MTKTRPWQRWTGVPYYLCFGIHISGPRGNSMLGENSPFPSILACSLHCASVYLIPNQYCMISLHQVCVDNKSRFQHRHQQFFFQPYFQDTPSQLNSFRKHFQDWHEPKYPVRAVFIHHSLYIHHALAILNLHLIHSVPSGKKHYETWKVLSKGIP